MVHVFWGPDTSWSTVVPRSRRPELPQEGDAWFPSSEEKTIGISVVLWPRIAWASGHIEPRKTKRVSKSECPGQKNLGLKKEKNLGLWLSTKKKFFTKSVLFDRLI